MQQFKQKQTKNGVIYYEGINSNGQYEIAIYKNNRRYSFASFKQFVEIEKTNHEGKKITIKKLETKSQVYARLKEGLGIA